MKGGALLTENIYVIEHILYTSPIDGSNSKTVLSKQYCNCCQYP